MNNIIDETVMTADAVLGGSGGSGGLDIASGKLSISANAINSSRLAAGSVSNINVSDTAAIAGSKISPSFTAPSVISVNSSSDALRITQTGSGNALVVEDSTNPDATPFVVNDQGQLLIGNSTSLVGPFAFSRGLQVTNQGAQFNAFTSNQFGEGIAFVKTRGTPSSPHTIVQLNDALGSVSFSGSDGSGYVLGSQIASFVDQVPGAGDMPTCLTFATTPDGSATCTERMRITSAGDVGIGTATPSVKLDIASTNEFSLGLKATTTSTQTPIINHPVALFTNSSTAAGNGLGLRFQLTDTGGTARTASGVGTVATAKDGSSVTSDLYFYTGATEGMRITSAGNVGIGTSSPSSKLQVNGTVTATEALTIGTAKMDVPSGSAPIFGARAWVSYDPTTPLSPAFSGTYSRSGTTVTVVAAGHGLKVGSLVYLDFNTGTATDGEFTILTVSTTTVTDDTFTVTHGTSGATSGNVTLPRATISGSGNVSSVSIIATGRQVVNFTTAMGNSNYAVVATVEDNPSSTTTVACDVASKYNGGCQIRSQAASGGDSSQKTSVIVIG
jgi:hypothetical protein